MRIAIVGAGISGLVAAHRLHRQHEIEVFEAASYPGGHTNTVHVELDGETHWIDTGFIVFNDWTYPNFIELLDELRVRSQPTRMGFSVRDEASGLEYAGNSINSLFTQRRNLVRPQFYRMLNDLLRFYRQSTTCDLEAIAGQTVGEFLKTHQYSEAFAKWHLLPMGAAIWSCPMGTFSEFPIEFVIEFYRNHGLVNLFRRPVWRVIEGGSRTYVDAIVAPFRDRLNLNSPVMGIHRGPDAVSIEVQGRGLSTFDHVIFACHSDQALKILGAEATANEREILSAFPYTRNKAVLHTDTSLLPRHQRAWASWNYFVRDSEHEAPCVTYNMNILQSLSSRHVFCVSLNPDFSRIDPSKILGEFIYEHPVFTQQRRQAQVRHPELWVANRTSFCGAYWRNGFHEDGVVSANEIVRAIQGLTPTGPIGGSEPGRVTVAGGRVR